MAPPHMELACTAGLLVLALLGCVIGPLYASSRRAERRRMQRARLASERDRALRSPGGQGQNPDMRLSTGFPARTAGSSRRPSFGGDR